MSAERFRARMASYRPGVLPALPGRLSHLPAGILVPLLHLDRQPAVVLVQRSAHLKHHPGELGFPGGKPEPGDRDLEATARREAEEELGVRAGPLLGRLSSTPLWTSDYRLEPFVAEVDGAPRPDGSEVVAAHEFPLLGGGDDPPIEGIPWTLGDRQGLSPVWWIPAAQRWLVGGTAHVLLELLQLAAAAWDRPAPRVVASSRTWSEVLPNRGAATAG